MNRHAARHGPGFATLAIHAGSLGTDADDPAHPDPCALLKERIATLEGGTAAVLTPPEWSAHLLVLQAVLERGGRALVSATLLGHTGLLERWAADFGWDVVSFDAFEPAGFAGLGPDVQAILVESMGTTGGIVDIEAIAAVAQCAGAPLIVDNTLASPYLIRPIEHGAHVVVHSGTTVLAGSGPASTGIIVDAGTFDWLARGKLAIPGPSGLSLADLYGNFALAAAIEDSPLCDIASGMDAGMAATILAGLETLPLRLQHQSDAARLVADRLARHPAVRRVAYAGSDPAFEPLVRRYRARGAGPLVMLQVAEGIDRMAVCARLQLFGRSTLAGATRSAILENCPENRLVLSIGLEDVEDLLADLDQALSAAR